MRAGAEGRASSDCARMGRDACDAGTGYARRTDQRTIAVLALALAMVVEIHPFAGWWAQKLTAIYRLPSSARIFLSKKVNQIMNKRILAIASCVAVISLSGCALTIDRIDLQYKQQQQGVSQTPGANNVSVNVQVADQRQEKSKVSSKKNGFGMEMAPILATEDVTVTSY